MEFSSTIATEHDRAFFFLRLPSGHIRFVSTSVLDTLGYLPEEFIEHFNNLLTGHELNSKRDRYLHDVLNNREAVIYPLEFFHKNGSFRWLEFREHPEFDSTRTLTHIFGWAFDISSKFKSPNPDKSEIPTEIVPDSDFILDLYRHIPSGIYTISPDKKITSLNKWAETITGYKESELIGKPCCILYSSPCPSHCIAFNEDIQKPSRNTERELRRKDGSIIPVSKNINVVRDKSGMIMQVIETFEDLSEKKELQKSEKLLQLKLIEQSKMASLGELATGIAHEVNQPLTYVSTFLQILDKEKDKFALPEVYHEKIEFCKKQVSRLFEVISHLRSFGRRENSSEESCHLKAVLNDAMLLLGERLKHRTIALTLELAEDLPKILIKPGQLEQIMLNLAQNSIDALATDIKHPSINIKALRNGVFVRIEFSDNGCGIPQEVKNRIFEPFFTTKEMGKGTGLGLSIIHDIVRDAGGALFCESELNQGTKFTFDLPLEA